jgi:GTP-binding protein HflX
MPEDITNELIEKVILVAVAKKGNEEETINSIDELEELAKTAGAITVGKIIQNRDGVHPGTYLGKGKIEEIQMEIIGTEATGVICDDELSPAQLKNLESLLDTKVIDRTTLILDIFAKHANTREGILQVELAQLKYRLTRLIGLGKSLSRLGGGIGTRGPGEKKLETDRRYIRNRIAALNDDIKQIKKHRNLLREGRKKQGKQVVAIVGYTNAGKSTLLNYLTEANVLQEDKLFATLDPTTRNLVLPEGKEILLTDTVGFIRKLPHHLIEAFKSTLEEAVYADIILHVVDSSNEHAERQMEVVYETLENLGVNNKPILTVFNKIDLESANNCLKDFKAFETLFISSANGQGIDKLLNVLEKKIREGKQLIKVVIPYSEGSKLQAIRSNGEIIVEEYQNEGTYIEAYLEDALVNKFWDTKD